MFDVVVIGGGLAGAMAALKAQQSGLRAALARRSYGATALSTGALDIAFSPALSPVQQVPRTIAEHVMDIVAHRPRHPFGVMGLHNTFDGLRQGFELLQPVLRAHQLDLSPLDLEGENLALPSAAGTLCAAGSAPLQHTWCGKPPLGGRWAVAGIAGDHGFDAERVAKGLQHDGVRWLDAPCDVEAVVVSVPDLPLLSPVLMAKSLDDPATVRQWASALLPRLRGFDGVIVPPVLGLSRHQATHAALQEALGLPVVESLGRMPSVPGLRLQNALNAALARLEVPILPGVVGAQVAEQEVLALITEEGKQISAGAFVLATGRFISGGVVWNGGVCREALFGLSVSTELGLLEEDSPGPVVRKTPEQSHPLMTAGVMVDSRLRPMHEGRVAFRNLFAAGMVLGGFASRYVLCADGVALSSGVLAGAAAASAAGERAAA